MGLLEKLKGIATGGTATLVEKIGDALDKNITNKEEMERAKNEVLAEANRHIEKITEAHCEQLELELKDLADARNMNVSIQNSDSASWLSKNIAFCLDILVGTVWGFLTIVITLKWLRFVAIDGGDFTGILSLYGTVTAVFMVSLNFHRSSTATSRAKSATIERMAEAKK